MAILRKLFPRSPRQFLRGLFALVMPPGSVLDDGKSTEQRHGVRGARAASDVLAYPDLIRRRTQVLIQGDGNADHRSNPLCNRSGEG